MLRDENSFFAQLFNSTQSLVALFKPGERTFIQINQYGIKMFGLQNAAEFSAFFQSRKIWSDAPTDLSLYLDNLEATVNAKGYLEKEMRYHTAHGTPFWGLLRIDRLTISGEEYFLVKITDIDAFKKAELKAVRSAKQFQALFHNSTMGVVITNAQGQIINFNGFAENQFGYYKEEILGQPVEVLIPQPFRQKHADYKRSFAHHPQNRVMGAGRDLYARRKDGSEFPVEISLSHYHIEDEIFVIAFVIDISVRKSNEAVVLKQKEELEAVSAQVRLLNVELEKKVEDRTNMLKETLTELERSKEELRCALEKEKELGELKSRFVTMASHEFRTPLSTILTSSYLVQHYTTAAEQEKRDKHLVKIQNAVHNLTFILEDFLSLEKLEEGQVQVKPEVLAEDGLTAEMESIADEMKNILKPGQSIAITHTALPHITTDKKLLRNILINLLSNATKYSPEHSAITINVVAENGQVKIAVADQGIGIPEADQKHLFERFFRASNAATIQGTGLGLHIVGRYLQLIKGGIEMKSHVDKGTTFTVVLPAEARL